MKGDSEVHNIFFRAAWGVLSWLGGLTLADVSMVASILSYVAGAVWFGSQAYFLWRDKRRK